MTDVDDEMGPMGVVPKSHQGELFELYDDERRWTGALRDDDVKRVPIDSAHYLKGRRGSITVHHCRAVHGSLPNLSPRMRPLLINAYSSADALTITPHPAPSVYAGTLVRGKPAQWAEFDRDLVLYRRIGRTATLLFLLRKQQSENAP